MPVTARSFSPLETIDLGGVERVAGHARPWSSHPPQECDEEPNDEEEDDGRGVFHRDHRAPVRPIAQGALAARAGQIRVQ